MVSKEYGLNDLLAIMKQLRDPDDGCPWDLEQDFRSIATYTLEEAYEVADAIERNELDDLKEELGDLLFQVVYHSELADEIDAFDFNDVVNVISAKLVRRHPHVFGSEDLASSGDIKAMWERVKQSERDEKLASNQSNASLLDDTPVGFPAMVRAVKLQSKAAKVGFDWPNIEPVLRKMDEELDELKKALFISDKGKPYKASDVEEELGDLLFVAANLARHLNIDPEAAARRANEKFCRRFHHIENHFNDLGVALNDVSLAEMDAIWDAAKRLEKRRPK